VSKWDFGEHKPELNLIRFRCLSQELFKVAMSHFSLPLTRLVHENLSVVMCFVYSRKPLSEMMEAKFRGEWKYLYKALFEVSAEHAEKACLELALFLRMIDDEEGISKHHAETKNVPSCGRLIIKNGLKKSLLFREVANKVIHSARLEWEFVKFPDPVLICHSREPEKWIRAEVDIVAVAAVCGQLMS
jgi:hypothetical protein